MAPLKTFTHKNTISYIFTPANAPVMSQTSESPDDEFSIVVPHVKELVAQDRNKASEETVQAVLYEIEDSKGNVVKYRVKFGDGAVYDVSDSDCRAGLSNIAVAILITLFFFTLALVLFSST